MICPDKVRDMCLFGMMCPREAVVDDDGECADYIRSALALMDAKEAARPDQADPVETAEVQQEREAIQGELALHPAMLKAPLRCRIAHWLCGESPSALFAGCKLGRRKIFGISLDCDLCPECMRPGDVIRTGKTIRFFYDNRRWKDKGAAKK